MKLEEDNNVSVDVVGAATFHDEGVITLLTIHAAFEDDTRAFEYLLIETPLKGDVFTDMSLIDKSDDGELPLGMRMLIDNHGSSLYESGMIQSITEQIDAELYGSYGADIDDDAPWSTATHVGRLWKPDEEDSDSGLGLLVMLRPPPSKMTAMRLMIKEIMSDVIYNEENPLIFTMDGTPVVK